MVAYLQLYRSGELHQRVQQAREILANCHICPRCCGVNRLVGDLGKCRTGERAVVSSYGPHFGEEAPLVGIHGSGTIFFTYCNLRCRFCQNYTISQLGEGREVNSEQLAAMMLFLQNRGCHNINLVSPTHVVPQILAALEVAIERGLRIPLVYNTGGYDALETLELLDGVIDIYMPDMKYSDERLAQQLSGIKDYPMVNRAAVKAMHQQVGDLILDERGVAERGLLVRHLVLPNTLAGTGEVVRFLSAEVSRDTYLNIMDQYHPAYKAFVIPGLARSLFPEEYQEAVRLAQMQGLWRLDDRTARVRLLVPFL